MRIINDSMLEGNDLIHAAEILGWDVFEIKRVIEKLESVGIIVKYNMNPNKNKGALQGKLVTELYSTAGFDIAPRSAYGFVAKLIDEYGGVAVMAGVKEMVKVGYLIGIDKNKILPALVNFIKNRQRDAKNGGRNGNAGKSNKGVYFRRDAESKIDDGRGVRGTGEKGEGDTKASSKYDAKIER